MVRSLISAFVLLATHSLLEQAAATRLLILADIHLNVNSTNQYVRPGDETSPSMLANVLIEASKREKGSKIDAILVVGDLCAHGLASYD